MSSPVNFITNTSLSVWAVQATIGHAIGAFLSLCVLSSLLCAAFVPGCPFRSPFSVFIRFIFESFEYYQGGSRADTFHRKGFDSCGLFSR